MPVVAMKPKEIFGHEIVSLINENAKAKLYVVCEADCGQLRLMKHIVRKTDADLAQIECLKHELELNKSLRSPVLRKSLDLKINKKLIGGITEAGLLMELVDGESIGSMPLLDPLKVMDIFEQLARGIASLHQQRHIHCDISPQHIMVCSDGQARLIDFAIAAPTNSIVPKPNVVHDFFGPEVARSKPVVPQTDIYSFGVSLYWALTHKRFPNIKYLVQGNWDRLQDDSEVPSPFQLNPAVPEPLSKLTMWCAKLALGSRPKDMATVIAGFEKIRERL